MHGSGITSTGERYPRKAALLTRTRKAREASANGLPETWCRGISVSRYRRWRAGAECEHEKRAGSESLPVGVPEALKPMVVSWHSTGAVAR